jgi:hypothetical protein
MHIIDHAEIPDQIYEMLFSPETSSKMTPRPLISDRSVQNFLGDLGNKMINIGHRPKSKGHRKYSKSGGPGLATIDD